MFYCFYIIYTCSHDCGELSNKKDVVASFHFYLFLLIIGYKTKQNKLYSTLLTNSKILWRGHGNLWHC